MKIFKILFLMLSLTIVTTSTAQTRKPHKHRNGVFFGNTPLPSSPKESWLKYDFVNNEFIYYDGTIWKTIGGGTVSAGLGITDNSGVFDLGGATPQGSDVLLTLGSDLAGSPRPDPTTFKVLNDSGVDGLIISNSSTVISNDGLSFKSTSASMSFNATNSINFFQEDEDTPGIFLPHLTIGNQGDLNLNSQNSQHFTITSDNELRLLKSGNTPVIGDVWTATNAQGAGKWSTLNISETESSAGYKYKGKEVFRILLNAGNANTLSLTEWTHNLNIDQYLKLKVVKPFLKDVTTAQSDTEQSLSEYVAANSSTLQAGTAYLSINMAFPAGFEILLEYTKN